jgi:hypothetical protein
MKIDRENLHTKETVEWFTCFQRIFAVLINHTNGIFGGVIRDYIAPCHRLLCEPDQFSSLERLVNKFGGIEINDIDVNINSMNELEDIINIIADTLSPADIIQSTRCCCKSIYSTPIIIDMKSYLQKNNIPFRIDFVDVSMFSNFVDFNINNLIYTKYREFELLHHCDEFYNSVMKNDPVFKENQIEINKDNRSKDYTQDACIQHILTNILQRKARFINTDNIYDQLIVITRFGKLIKHGYTIEDNHIDCIKEVNESDNHNNDMCSICHNCDNNTLTIRTTCGHFYHLSCLHQWIETKNIKCEKSNCPNCRAEISQSCVVKTTI